MDATQEVYTMPGEDNAVDLMKAAFASPNNRTIVFKAVRNSHNDITDFKFSLVSQGTIDFFKGNNPTGKTFFEILPDQLNQFEMMKQVTETGITNNWVRHYADIYGEEKWFSASDAKSGDGIVRVWEDVTERMLQEREIYAQKEQEAEQKYLSLFNYLDEGFCVIEMIFDKQQNPTDYKFLLVNTAFEKITDLTGVVGKTMKEFRPGHEQYWFDTYGNVVKTGQPIHFEQKAEQLQNRWYEVTAFPLSSNRKNNKVAVIFNDISERKNNEQQLNAFNLKLEEQVKERTEKINTINELLEIKNTELEKTNKELESFNYVASHDLQEPLRKIQTFISILKNVTNDPEASRSYMEKIASSASRMSALIQDVLVYSRLSAENQFTQVDLNQVLNNVLSDYDLLIAEKNATIIKTNLPVITAVALHMQQLFSNLISNSLKYNDKTPVIKIACKTVTDAKGKTFAEITFSDNGIGFEPEYNDLIFKLFQRLHGKKEYGGTGIGLSICKSIMDQHQGSIAAKSVPGHGASFTLRFPV